MLMNNPLRILCIDDSPSAGELAMHALASHAGDFELSVARNRGEFELLLCSGRWDLVLTDYQSLGYDRLEILDVVRARDVRLAVVILTDSGSEAIAAEAIKRGATDYLTSHAEQMLRLPDMLRAAAAQQRDMMSASELRAVLEASGDGIVVVSNAGKVIHSNDLALEIWNVPPSMIGVTDFGALQAFVAEQMVDPSLFMEVSRKSLCAQSSSSATLAFKDGRVVERHAKPQMLDGRRIGWVISYRDTTEAVRAEQHLKKSLALQRATLDATADGILVVDPQRRVVGTNRKFQDLWRIPDELMASDDDARLVSYVLDQLEDPDAFVMLVESLYERPADVSRDILQFKDGRVFERYSQPQFVDGVPAGRVWSFRDITAINEVEAALRGSEARFRLMFETTADALMILDGASSRFIDCNQATVDIFHCASKQAILTLHPAQLSPSRQPDGRDSVDKANEMIAIAMREGSHRFEWMHCSAQREDFPAEVLLTPVVSGEQRLVIATVRDISDRKREERTQHALWEISEAAQSTETLVELFPRIHQIVSGLLPARNFFVALYDEKRAELNFPYYEDEFDTNPDVLKMSDGTVTGRVIERGEAMLFTPDNTNDGRLEDLPYAGTGSMDWLGVPLKSKSRTLGALVVQSYDGSIRYTERDKSLLEFVCGQVAAAIERKQAEVDLRESEARLEEAQRLAQLGSWKWDIRGHVLTWSDELYRIFDLDPQQHVPRVRDFLSRIHCDDRATIESLMIKAQEDCQPFRMEMRIRREGGEIRTLQSQVEVRVDPQGRATGMVGACLDISARKLEELLDRDRRQILEQVARNEPLQHILAGVVGMLETQIPGSRCSLLLLRDGRLYMGSAPLIPEVYSKALEGLPIGPRAGSCGTACYLNKTVVVQDIASDPLWDGYRELALPHDLRACWSMPIPSSDGGVLGSFAVYHHRPCAPTAAELDFVTAASRLAAVAIEHRRLTDRLAHQGQHDALTGLPNRLLLQDRLGQALVLALRKQHQVAVLFMDLDHFKQINDTLGHSHGDILLCEVARRLEGSIRKSDTLARLGGDEFMLVVPELNDAQDAMRVAGKMMESLRAPFQVGEHEFFVSVSLGISIYPADGQDADTLMANADAAMYRAKEAGRDNCMWFTPQMNTRMMERVELESQFRHAMALGQLSLNYQPQCGPADEIQGFEALLRWQHPTQGMVPPARFIPLAEESGLIVPIGEWVMHEACSRTAAWHRAGHTDLRISVNVSAVQFRRGNLLDMVRRVLAETRLDPSALVLEITESLLLQNAAEASVNLAELRKLGVGIAIDDFGTGYSSLSYLHKLPVTALKIDQSFVCEIGMKPLDGRDEAPIIRTIIALARNLGLTVVAEGVETRAQLDLLKSLGCDGFQGYLLHLPLTEDAAGQLLAEVAELRRSRAD
ncbi:MAG: EAL domain-containing protein [Rhodanobacter sp.]|nr:EAL domain-containing protein [Rhodanobacter sp.]